MELLIGLSREKIDSKLKQYFTDDELADVSFRLGSFITISETLTELIEEIDDYLVERYPADLI